MSTSLDSGILLTLFTPAQEYRLGDPLGRGSEGTVYEVRNEAQAVELALKWYHPDQAFPSRYSTLNHLVRRGAPGNDFLWPRAVIGSDNQSQFGYVMDLSLIHI